MKTFIKSYAITILVLAYAYAAKPATPQWLWSVPSQASGTLDVKYNLWWGDKSTKFSIYADSITVVKDVPTGDSGSGASFVSAQISLDAITTSGTYGFVIEACNQSGCTSSSAKNITVTAVASTGSSSTTTVVTPDAPDEPHIGTISIEDDGLSVSWEMWWGKSGNTAKLYLGDTLVSTESLSDYTTSNSSQKGKFTVPPSQLEEKGISLGAYVAYVELCKDSSCTKSTTQTIDVTWDVTGAVDESTEAPVDDASTPVVTTPVVTTPVVTTPVVTTPAPRALEISVIPSQADGDFSITLTREEEWSHKDEILKLEHKIPALKRTINHKLGKATKYRTTFNMSVNYVKTESFSATKTETIYEKSAVGGSIDISTDMSKPIVHEFTFSICNDTGCTKSPTSTVTIKPEKVTNPAIKPAVDPLPIVLVPMEPEVSGPSVAQKGNGIDPLAFKLTLSKPIGTNGNVWKLKHTIKGTNRVGVYNLGEAKLGGIQSRALGDDAIQTKDIEVRVIFSRNDVKVYDSPREVDVADSHEKYITILASTEAKFNMHVFTPMLCNDKGCTVSTKSKDLKIVYTGDFSEYDPKPKVPTKVTTFNEAPSAPVMSTLSPTYTKDFEFTLNKWYGTPGTSWKLEHTVEETNMRYYYELGSATVSPSNPKSKQSKTVNIKVSFSDVESDFTKHNDIVTANVDATDGQINIVSFSGEELTHSFVPMLCNNIGCTSSATSVKTHLADPSQAGKVKKDKTDRGLENANIVKIVETDRSKNLNLDKSTWTTQQKTLIGLSLKEWKSKIRTSNTPYTAPTPKTCPNISNGKINGKESMIYYASWAMWGRQHYPRDIDGCNYTGVLFAFGYPAPNGRLYLGDGAVNVEKHIGNLAIPASRKYSDDPKLGFYGGFSQLIQFKKEYPHIKTYLSVGGWTWSTYLAAIANAPEIRKVFIADTIEMLRTFQFDGIDIDWEFPSNATDRANLTKFLTEFRAALDEAVQNPKPGFEFSTDEAQKKFIYVPANKKFTLSIAVAPNPVKDIQYMDLAKIDPLLDFVVLMSYDYAGSWDTKTGHLTALYTSGNAGETVHKHFNVSSAVNAYINGEVSTTNPGGFNNTGFTASKVMLGLGYYGRGWETDSKKVYQKVGANKAPVGTWENGAIDYKALVETYRADRSNWTLIWDEKAKAPMAHGHYKGNGSYGLNGKVSKNAMWTFDDARSVCEKVNYAKTQNLGGVFGWESSSDNGELTNSAVNSLKGNVDCDTVYPADHYDVVYDGGSDTSDDSQISGGKLTQEELDAAKKLLEEQKKKNGNDKKDDNKQDDSSVGDSNLPSIPELKKAAQDVINSLNPKEKDALAHLQTQLTFDRTVLGVGRSLSREASNVAMVKSVISEDVFNQLFPMAMSTIYNYDSFLKAVQAFPMLCGESGQTQTQCKEELAAIFGNFAQETGANIGDLSTEGRTLSSLYSAHYKNPGKLVGEELSRTNSPDAVAKLKKRLADLKVTYTGDTSLDNIRFVIPKWRQGLYAVAESNCRAGGTTFSEIDCPRYRGSCEDNYYGKVWQCAPNAAYYGRGAHQLTHNYNYGRFGSFIWGAENRQKLLDNPNYIIDDEPWLSMLSATWFHMYSTGTKPSMHDIALKKWTPGTDDVASSRGQTFGTMINVINGGIECGKVTPQATSRAQSYREFRKYLGLPEVSDDFVRCDNQVAFSSKPTNSGNAPIYYAKGDTENTCKLVTWERGFSVYDPDYSGYIECVKFNWGKSSDRPTPKDIPQGNDGSGSTDNKNDTVVIPSNSLGAWTKGYAYKAGDIVGSGKTYYECKPWPFTGWCKDREPGIGNGWEQAWNIAKSSGSDASGDDATTQDVKDGNSKGESNKDDMNDDNSKGDNPQDDNPKTDKPKVVNLPIISDDIDGYEKYENIGSLSLGSWGGSVAYKAGDIVEASGTYYQCKPAPYTPWCKDREPVVGNGWSAAWDIFTGKINKSANAKEQEAAKQASLKKGVYSNGLAIVRNILGTKTTWAEGFNYATGDIVEQDKKKYSCNPFPASGWCGQRQPELGNEWKAAWTIFTGTKLATPADFTRVADTSSDKILDADYMRFAQTLFDIDITSSKKLKKLTDSQYDQYEAEVLKHTVNAKLNTARGSVVKLKDVYASHGLTLSDFSDLQGSKALLNLDVDSNKWPANVKRVKKVMSEDRFNYFFPLRDKNSFGNGVDKVVKPSGSYSYKNFLNAAAFYPKFCNEAFDENGNAVTDEAVLDITCKKALSGMFAHFAQEVGGHDTDYAGSGVQGFSEPIPAYRQGLFHMYEMGCDIENPSTASCGYRSCDENLYGCASNELIQYMGRGAKQLSYNYNYITFGQEVFGFDKGDILKNNPDLIAKDGRLALLSAFFFYMTPQPPKPSMHEIDTKAWVPNKSDIAAKRYRGFGASVMVINAECVSSGNDKAQAQNRFNYYKSFMKDFGIENEIDASKDQTCVGMKQFDGKSSSSYLSYWEKHWTISGVCQLVSYQTKYSAFQQGTYKECVKDKFFK